MSLIAGLRLGQYEILTPLGAGGMGEVYRARDTKLNRDVALKILPTKFALDPDRLARFKREAQVLASLNHPHIAAIYGFEDSGETHALVLELVEGPTLADRIAKGPVPFDEALPIAKQIAEALEAAHEQGVIHRDLKPANIKLRLDGVVKVLDFGLAKLLDTTTAGSEPRAYSPGLTNSPTMTSPALMTGVGMLLGTAAYMSPEQAKGRPADKRSDIWAFGCVFYEMLTGKRAFDGEDVSDTLAFVLTKPVDLGALPTVPVAVRRLLRRCLEKDRAKRLAAASAVRVELEDAMFPRADEMESVGAATPPVASTSQRIVTAALLIAVLAVTFVAWHGATRVTSPQVTRFTIPLPEGQRFTENGLQVVAVSPDGSHIAYVANRRLYLRSLSDFEAKLIPGTEVAVGQSNDPVFSPDGSSIAWLAGRPPTLKRVAIAGGAPVTICDACIPSGVMSWDKDGIVFAQGGTNSPTGNRYRPAPGTLFDGANRIVRVPADGGPPKVLLNIPDGFAWNVQMLPGGDALLFGFVPGGALNGPGGVRIPGGASFDKLVTAVESTKSPQRRVLVEGAAGARYLQTGHLVYAREGILFARRFDIGRLEVTGEEVPVVEGVRRPNFFGGNSPSTPYFDVSATGTLVYVPGPTTFVVQTDLALVAPQSTAKPVKLPARTYEFPRISPDGKWIAVQVSAGDTANVWIYETSGTTSIRQLTFGGKNRFPVWSSDGQYVAFQSDREGDLGLFWQRADGTGAAERLTKAEMGTAHIPDAWFNDGSQLLFDEAKDGRFILRTLSLRDRKTTSVGTIQASSYLNAAISPDGHWLAYRSISGGASAIAVEPLPPTGAKYVIGNGIYPVWSRDGKTLFFRELTTQEFMATRVTTQAGFSFTTPELVPVNVADRTSNATVRNHDMLPDGRFLIVVSATAPGASPIIDRINVVINWTEELKQRVPVK
jgi:serine/threonine-protein kinase